MTSKYKIMDYIQRRFKFSYERVHSLFCGYPLFRLYRSISVTINFAKLTIGIEKKWNNINIDLLFLQISLSPFFHTTFVDKNRFKSITSNHWIYLDAFEQSFIDTYNAFLKDFNTRLGGISVKFAEAKSTEEDVSKNIFAHIESAPLPIREEPGQDLELIFSVPLKIITPVQEGTILRKLIDDFNKDIKIRNDRKTL